MTRVYANDAFEWRENRLGVRGDWRGSPSVEIVPDERYPDMWRVRLTDGTLTDMVNRTRARDAARAILRAALGDEAKGAVASLD